MNAYWCKRASAVAQARQLSLTPPEITLSLPCRQTLGDEMDNEKPVEPVTDATSIAEPQIATKPAKKKKRSAKKTAKKAASKKAKASKKSKKTAKKSAAARSAKKGRKRTAKKSAKKKKSKR
ncbi:MAG TPA: hypothetical protein VJV58_11085 [Bradyrhizobium sp.]|uniref:hypothetical protein n=1 Tax=Bradyrhizobium sp. TaxID=376 RepID=UPI002B49EE6F|nr:hypothetical protein [Bradyrhizobium sp.]HKO71466.1 hypothetical protein [Bradyrhizobium sp.]